MLLSGPWYICGVRSRGKFWLYLWHSMAWHSQVSTHRCPSLHRAQHDAQHHPFTRSSICEDLLWDSAQSMAWHWSLLPAGRAANLALPGPQCHSHDPGSSPSKHSLVPARGWATPGQWASLDTTETRSKVQGGHLFILSFPLLPRACKSYVLIHLLPFALCLLPSLLLSKHASLPTGPSSTCLKAGRQSYTWRLWGKIESVLCCIN